MQNFFASAQAFIERDSGRVRVVRLDEDNPAISLNRDLTEGVDEISGDAAASVGLRDREIVDVELGSLLFELHQFIASERAHDTIAIESDERHEVIGSEKAAAPDAPRARGAICLVVLEGLAKEIEHRLVQRMVSSSETTDQVGRCHGRASFASKEYR